MYLGRLLIHSNHTFWNQRNKLNFYFGKYYTRLRSTSFFSLEKYRATVDFLNQKINSCDMEYLDTQILEFKCLIYILEDIDLLYPRSPKVLGGILFYLCPSVRPSVQDIFSHIFLSNCWWQKSDIWSQASYRYTILWIAFLNPSDSCFLFADLVGFYTHWTYMHIFRHNFLSNYWWQKSDIWSQASYRYPISWEAFLDPSDSYFLFADFVDFYTHLTYVCICTFFVTFFSATIDGRDLIFGHKLHIGRDRAGLRQCRHLRFLISFGDKIRPLAIFWATTFYLSKITSDCCQSTAQVRNIVC